MDSGNVKRHTTNVSLATLGAWLTIFPALWFFGRPVMEQAVVEAVADEIKDEVQSGVKPVRDAFAALMKRDVEKIRREIASMEFRKENDSSNWTEIDNRRLENLRIDLDAAKLALAELEKKNEA